MRTADEILQQAKRLPPDQRRRVAEELLEELDECSAGEVAKRDKGPYAHWLDAAGSVRSDFSDLSTDKYKHVAASTLHGHADE
jgi:hypothetical protein